MYILYGENTLFDKLTSVNEKMMGIRGPSTDVPNPWQDTWHEVALKKLMKTAVDEGYDYVMVPKSETLVAKWGAGPTEKAPEGAFSCIDILKYVQRIDVLKYILLYLIRRAYYYQ